MYPQPFERFMAKVDKNGPLPTNPALGPCWLWTASASERGYGSFGMLRRVWRANRASWFLHRGPIPRSMHVLHFCDNPRCVNPDHLFLGTHADNMADMKEKGRAPKGERSGAHKKPWTVKRGEKSGCNKVTEADVVEIRRRVKAGERAYLIAHEYGISDRQAYDIVNRDSWRHVPDDAREELKADQCLLEEIEKADPAPAPRVRRRPSVVAKTPLEDAI